MLLRRAAYFFGAMPHEHGNSRLTGSRRESSISAAAIQEDDPSTSSVLTARPEVQENCPVEMQKSVAMSDSISVD